MQLMGKEAFGTKFDQEVAFWKTRLPAVFAAGRGAGGSSLDAVARNRFNVGG